MFIFPTKTSISLFQMAPATTLAGSIPPEVVEQFISQSDTVSLRTTTSLVSARWRDISQRILFTAIHVDPFTDNVIYNILAPEYARLRAFVKTLHIVAESEDTLNGTSLLPLVAGTRFLEFLRQLPNVTDIGFGPTRLDWARTPPDVINTLIEFVGRPAVHTLLASTVQAFPTPLFLGGQGLRTLMVMNVPLPLLRLAGNSSVTGLSVPAEVFLDRLDLVGSETVKHFTSFLLSNREVAAQWLSSLRELTLGYHEMASQPSLNVHAVGQFLHNFATPITSFCVKVTLAGE